LRINGRTSGLISSLSKSASPALRRDERVVGAEQHPVAKQRVRVLDELRWEVLRRPARQVDVDLRLVHGDRQRLVLPRKRRVRENDLQGREVDRDVVDVHRVRVLEANAAAAGQPRADARLPRVEERGQPRLFDHLVERVRHAVVREEALGVRVELEAAHAVFVDQTPRLLDTALALVRIDARKRDEDVGVRARHRSDLLVWNARLPGERLRVDREDDGHHLALAIERGKLERRRPRRRAAEMLDGGVAQLVRQGIGAGLGHLDVRVHVDRDDVVECEWRLSHVRHPRQSQRTCRAQSGRATSPGSRRSPATRRGACASPVPRASCP